MWSLMDKQCWSMVMSADPGAWLTFPFYAVDPSMEMFLGVSRSYLWLTLLQSLGGSPPDCE